MEAEFVTIISNVISVLVVGLIVSVVDPYIVTRKTNLTLLDL